MKINEVCKKTKLSERAIRLYVEKGLIKPKSQYVNGRTNLDFTEEDVELLTDISVLRKTGFSIADIISMQNSSEAVCDVVKKHRSELELEQHFRKELIQKLNDISTRGNISWRKLANVLEKSKLDYQEQSICIPLEQLESFELEENSLKNRIKKMFKWIVLVLVAAIIIFIFAYDKQNHKLLTTNFTISEVVVDKKWKRGDDYYVAVYSLDYEEGMETHFKAPRTAQVSREYYEAFQLDNKSYDSFEIWIEISYADAKDEEILDENGNILIEKVLAKERLMRDYCYVRRIEND